MCAIAGVVGKIDLIKQMSSVMRHRGPDDEKIKIYNEKKVSISMMRLSILDLKSKDCAYMKKTDLYFSQWRIYNYQN